MFKPTVEQLPDRICTTTVPLPPPIPQGGITEVPVLMIYADAVNAKNQWEAAQSNAATALNQGDVVGLQEWQWQSNLWLQAIQQWNAAHVNDASQVIGGVSP